MQRTITVKGVGTVRVRPDQIELGLGMKAKDRSYQRAMESAGEQLLACRAELKYKLNELIANEPADREGRRRWLDELDELEEHIGDVDSRIDEHEEETYEEYGECDYAEEQKLIFKAYQRGLLRELRRISEALSAGDAESAKTIVTRLIEDTEKDI